MPTLGLSMIAKNEAHTLRACLQSVAGIISQIVVADTGSTDETAQIAREFGATVISVPWANHFANARNAALAPLQTDWVLVLDADEELDSAAKDKLPRLLNRNDVGGYLTPIRNYVPTASGRGWDRVTEPNDRVHPRAKDAPAYFVHENCRLFRRNPEIYFVGRVHELVEPRIAALKLKLPMADFCIHHFGQLADEEHRKKKMRDYLDLLRLKVKELPNEPMAWLQLGLQEYECSGEPAEALQCFDHAVALEPKAVQGWLFKGMVLINLGRYAEALDSLNKVGQDKASRALCEQLRGDALHNLGRLDEAMSAYKTSLETSGNDPVLISKLGYTEVRLGRAQAGVNRLHKAAAAAPELAEICERLMKACMIMNDLPEAAEQAEKLARLEATPRSYIRAASIRVHIKDVARAQEILGRGLTLYPASLELQQAMNEVSSKAGVRAQTADRS